MRLMTHAAFYLINDLTQMGNLGYRRLLESHVVRQNGERIKEYLMIAFALQIQKDRGSSFQIYAQYNQHPHVYPNHTSSSSLALIALLLLQQFSTSSMAWENLDS